MEVERVVTRGEDASCQRILIRSFLARGEGAVMVEDELEKHVQSNICYCHLSLRSWKVSPGEPCHANPNQVVPQAAELAHLEEGSSDGSPPYHLSACSGRPDCRLAAQQKAAGARGQTENIKLEGVLLLIVTERAQVKPGRGERSTPHNSMCTELRVSFNKA